MTAVAFYGELVHTLRMEHGISQRVLQVQTGVNRTFIRKLEYGQEAGLLAELDKLEKLLDYFGYDLEVIKREDGTAPQAPEWSSGPRETKRREVISA